MIAKIKSTLDAKVGVSPHYRTLFTGLKVNHPRKVGLVHPLAFFAYRIAFLAIACSLAASTLAQAFMAMVLVMSMLAFSLHDQPWTEAKLNRQASINEAAVYLLTTLVFLHRGNFLGTVSRGLGHSMLALLGLLLAFNALTMLHTAGKAAILCGKRLFSGQINRRNELRKEVRKVAERISHEPALIKLNQQPEREINISLEDVDGLVCAY